jgi:3-methyladenine DNA glycosylase/8-oxoguanine DNA glycosylase
MTTIGQAADLHSSFITEIQPAAPFHFDATLHKPDHFPSADNAWQPGVRWQAMLWQGTPLGLKFENAGTVEQPEVRLSVWSEAALSEDFRCGLMEEVYSRYNFGLDLRDFCARFESHPRLGPVIARWRGMRPLNCSSLYEYLMIAIVLQNATVRRSVQMMQALLERYGTGVSYDGRDLYCPWSPAGIHAATEEELRGLKVGYRARSIKRVTEAFVAGDVNELVLRGQPKAAQRRALLALYGVGPASAEYILSDVFHHGDEMVHISPWEQRIYSVLFFDRDPEDPAPVAELLGYFNDQFAPYQMLAVHYFWEDLFWRRHHEPVPWLEKLIRL